MNRLDFKKAVLSRDQDKCVICQRRPDVVHHIMERKLFPDGGNEIDNGVSLCEAHHWAAETTVLSTAELRQAAGIIRIILSPYFGPGEYDKWGNIITSSGIRHPGPLYREENVQIVLKMGDMLDKFSNIVHVLRTCPFRPAREKTI